MKEKYSKGIRIIVSNCYIFIKLYKSIMDCKLNKFREKKFNKISNENEMLEFNKIVVFI